MKTDSEAIEYLRGILKPQDTLWTIVRHVSKSGMSREITCCVIVNGEIRNVSWAVARALGWRYNADRGAVRVSGCGMDMCFHTVYSVAQVLFGDGYAIEKRGI